MNDDRRQEWFLSRLAEIDEIHDTFRVPPEDSLRMRIDAATTNFGLETGTIEEESGIAAFARRLAEYRSLAELKGKRPRSSEIPTGTPARPTRTDAGQAAED